MVPNTSDPATIGRAVKVVGQIYSKENLCVEGELEGTVEAFEYRLTIGPSGQVHAGVKAREVVVLGSIQGDVEATDKIQIHKDARVVGNIKTARIIIEDGAYFKGAIDIVKLGSTNPLEGQHSASDLDRLAQATSRLEPMKVGV